MKDYYIAVIVGIITGIFAIPTFYNLGIENLYIFIALFIVIPPLLALGVWLGKFLSRWFAFFAQFGKFATIGFLSASIDFGVLNILNIATGISAGFIVGGVNIPGFGLAVANSYLWNKLWAFKREENQNFESAENLGNSRQSGESFFNDFPKYLSVSLVGAILNSAIIILITTYITSFYGIGPEGWLNAAKVIASAIVLVWNFTGYKFIVFRQ